MPATDGELIEMLLEKDVHAFDQLFFRYKDHVYRFILYLTQSRAESEDLFQETWLRVVKYLPSTSKIKCFKSWLFTIAVNLHRDELRKRKLRRLFTLQKTVLSDIDIENNDHSIIPSVNDRSNEIEINLALSKALAALPLKQKRVFILKEIEGFKHAEISKILNIPVGTIKSLLHRAIKQLQYELSEFHNQA